jgi:hypothetical protein
MALVQLRHTPNFSITSAVTSILVEKSMSIAQCLARLYPVYGHDTEPSSEVGYEPRSSAAIGGSWTTSTGSAAFSACRLGRV